MIPSENGHQARDSQIDWFSQAAGELACDLNESRRHRRLRKVARRKPVEKAS